MGIKLEPYLGKMSQDESYLLMDILNDLNTPKTIEFFIEKYSFKRIRYIFGSLYKTNLDIDVMDDINYMFEELLKKFSIDEYPEKWI